MFKKWREKRRAKRMEKFRNQSLEEVMERVKNADYVLETGASSLFPEGAFKDYSLEELRRVFLEAYGIDIVNPDAGPDWMPATH